MVAKRLSRAYNPPVPAGQVVEWIGSPPHNAGVLPLLGQGFNGAHFPELLAQHGDAVLPTKAPVDGVYPVVGHGQQGEVQLVNNDTALDFNEIIHDFGETISGFRTAGDQIIVWANYGKCWGSTDGGNNFTLLPAYLNSGSPGSTTATRIIGDIQFGNGVWVATFDGYSAICRGDILVPANWVALPVSMGGLTNGVTTSKHKIATDGNGNWLVAGEWHQFAWTNDDWVTINVTTQPDGTNGASLKIPLNVPQYANQSYCICTDDGVFFAGNSYSVPQRSDDGLNTWSAVTNKFNTLASNSYNPTDFEDLGAGHLLVLFASQYVAETFDAGVTWIRRADYLSLGSAIQSFAADKNDMFLVSRNDAGDNKVHTSKDASATLDAGIVQTIYTYSEIKHWRDSWYAISTDRQKIVRSVLGYTRTEWELV